MTTKKVKPALTVPHEVGEAGPVRTRPNPRGEAILCHVLLGRHAKQIEFQDSIIL